MERIADIHAAPTRQRTWQEETKMLLSLLDCVVFGREAVYASSEFTTGKRFYDLCRHYNVKTADELQRRLGNEYSAQLLTPNKDAGIRFARELRKLGHSIVLTPNPFHAAPLDMKQNWSQDEYLEFWRDVISQKCSAVYFNDAWQFSNGCTFEYYAALRAGLKRFDSSGKPLEIHAAAGMIAAAIKNLEADGFAVPKLVKILDNLRSLPS